MPSELKVVKAFISFIEVENLSAIGLHKLIMNSIQQKGLDIKKQGIEPDPNRMRKPVLTVIIFETESEMNTKK